MHTRTSFAFKTDGFKVSVTRVIKDRWIGADDNGNIWGGAYDPKASARITATTFRIVDFIYEFDAVVLDTFYPNAKYDDLVIWPEEMCEVEGKDEAMDPLKRDDAENSTIQRIYPTAADIPDDE